jgi:hypothetical protein
MHLPNISYVNSNELKSLNQLRQCVDVCVQLSYFIDACVGKSGNG